MTFDNRLSELFDAATASVPPGSLAAPLPAIHRRVRRRRAVTTLAVVGVVAGLVVGLLIGRAPIDRAGPPATGSPTPSVSADLRVRVAWDSALLARDGRTVTVYAGPSGGCQELIDGTAVVTRQDGGQVTIAVRAWIVPATDCGPAVPIQMRLEQPLGDREVRDAATGQPRTAYREADLPDLRKTRWTPYPQSWPATEGRWSAAYNDNLGWTLRIDGEPGRTAGGDPSDSLTLGSRQGWLLSVGTHWAVRWSVGDLTYELSLIPPEGRSLTRSDFEAELSRYTWP